MVEKWRKIGLFQNEMFKKLANYYLEKDPREAHTLRLDALDVAIESNAVDLCRINISRNRKPVSEKDQHGWTPLVLAVQARQHDTIQQQ
jgi:ankyrin repeat protein